MPPASYNLKAAIIVASFEDPLVPVMQNLMKVRWLVMRRHFLVNNHWTFADRNLAGRKRLRGLKFNAVSLLSLARSYGTFLTLSLMLLQAASLWLQGMAIVPAALVNYFPRFLLDIPQ